VLSFGKSQVVELGVRPVSFPNQPGSLLYDSALATTRAMKRSGVKRLVILSAAAHFPGIPNRIVSFVLRNHMRDSRGMEEIVRNDGSIGQSSALRVSLRKITRRIEAGRALLPRWVSQLLAKLSRRSCSTRSSKRNISIKGSASRNNNCESPG
jgi:hypothetical protein